MQFNQFTRTAIKAALKGGQVLRKYYNTSIRIEYKGLVDPVTIADRTAQTVIIKALRSEFPKHSFMGEEDSHGVVCNENCWIIDPLDGTVNFIHAMPMFCVSVALMYRGRIVSAVIHSPIMNETFVAELGKGAYLNSKRIHVSSISRLINAMAITGFPYEIRKNSRGVFRKFNRVVLKTQAVRRLGSAALDMAYVACGRAEAFWEEDLKPWDVAAGSLIIQEAGGKVSDFRGGEEYIFKKKIVATNGRLHRQMLGHLKY